MKRLVAVSSVFFLLITSATPGLAQGVYSVAKGKARNINNQNNAAQGVAPAQPAAPATGAAGTSTNAPKGIDPAQQANIDKLASDFAEIKPGVRVPLDQRKQIVTDTLKLAKGTAKPSPESLTNLVKDLSSALAGGSTKLKDTGPAVLAKNINIVVNSVNLTAGQVQPAIIAARNVLLTSGVVEDDYKPVVTDLNAIVTELQKNKAKPAQ